MQLEEIRETGTITVEQAMRAYRETGMRPTPGSFGGCLFTALHAACGLGEGEDAREALPERVWKAMQAGYDYEGTACEDFRRGTPRCAAEHPDAFERGREICRAVLAQHEARVPDYPPALGSPTTA